MLSPVKPQAFGQDENDERVMHRSQAHHDKPSMDSDDSVSCTVRDRCFHFVWGAFLHFVFR